MIVCPYCQKTVVTAKHCSQCGKEIPVPGDASATMLFSAAQIHSRTGWQQSLDLNELFSKGQSVILGRAPDCDYRIQHPSVSRYHARIEKRADGLYVSEIRSTNGVWVNGKRIGPEAQLVREGDRVGIGPVVLLLSAGVLRTLDSSQGLRLEARSLEKIVRGYDGKPRTLLKNISLVINPGEFVALLGPSGSGKSTLMDCLNGRRPATSGAVLANGLDFYRNFNNFRQLLGYVPQKDIVHSGLAVERALYYTARLRLPLDTAFEEFQTRIESVIALMELDRHRQTLISNLSGGQIKRVSLGAELLAEPALLYIDEATSGLDAGTEARMMRLFRELSSQGRSLLCITHNVDNVEQCHNVIVLAQGHLIYFGPPDVAPSFFGATRMSEIYDQITNKDPDYWQQKYRESSHYQDLIERRLAESPAPAPVPQLPPVIKAALNAVLGESGRKLAEHLPMQADYFRNIDARKLAKEIFWERPRVANNQFFVLVRRYLELIWADHRGLRLLLLQGPVVALFLLVGFIGKDFTSPMPLLREIEPEERRMLQLHAKMVELVDAGKPLTSEQKQALAKIKVQMAGFPTTMDGNSIIKLLRHLQSHEMSGAERAMLKSANFTVDLDGQPTTVSALEIIDSWKRVQGTRLSKQILELQGPIFPKGQGINPRYTYILLFVLVMIVLWFGCNNAAKEIVKEEPIYNRERAVNLGILPYLASKFLVMGAVTIGHVLVLMLCVYGPLELIAYALPGHSVPPPEHMLSYGSQFLVLSLLALTGVALGLLLSACVSSPDRANALLPYVLIPQMILGGGILTVSEGALYYLATVLSPVYWAYRAVHRGADQLTNTFPGYDPHPDGILIPCVALGVQLVVLLLLTVWFMRQKDV